MSFGIPRIGGRNATINNNLRPALLRACKKYCEDMDEEYDEEEILTGDGSCLYDWLIDEFLPQCKDLQKVAFDTENLDIGDDEFGDSDFVGFHTLPNGLEYLGFCAGGDGEIPLYGIIYHDGKKLRGYIPECGNTYDTDYGTAFNSEFASNKSVPEEVNEYPVTTFMRKRGCEPADGEDEELLPDVELMIKDIMSRIVIK